MASFADGFIGEGLFVLLVGGGREDKPGLLGLEAAPGLLLTRRDLIEPSPRSSCFGSSTGVGDSGCTLTDESPFVDAFGFAVWDECRFIASKTVLELTSSTI
jgi:hypothetical protein